MQQHFCEKIKPGNWYVSGTTCLQDAPGDIVCLKDGPEDIVCRKDGPGDMVCLKDVVGDTIGLNDIAGDAFGDAGYAVAMEEYVASSASHMTLCTIRFNVSFNFLKLIGKKNKNLVNQDTSLPRYLRSRWRHGSSTRYNDHFGNAGTLEGILAGPCKS